MTRGLDIVALGEPLIELTAEEPGHLKDVTRFCRGWGGDTSNVVVAAARLGARCGYLSCVGGDQFGEAFLELWRGEGVDTSEVYVDAECRTGVYFVSLRPDGEREFTYYRSGSAASRMHPGRLRAEYLRKARILHTSGISQAISDSCRDTVEAAIRLAREAGLTVSYDANARPQLRDSSWLRETFRSTVPLVDILFLSEQDAELLFPQQGIRETMESLADQGPRIVVLARGERGCLLAADGAPPGEVPGWEVEAVDTTGAGDAFAGAFLAEWIRGAEAEEAARLANAAAALSTTGRGAVTPLPRRKDVERLLGHSGQARARAGS